MGSGVGVVVSGLPVAAATPKLPKLARTARNTKKERVYNLPEHEQPPSSPHMSETGAILTSPANPVFPATPSFMLVNTSPCFSGEFKVTASDGHGWQQVRGCSGYPVTISGDSLSLACRQQPQQPATSACFPFFSGAETNTGAQTSSRREQEQRSRWRWCAAFFRGAT